jgi:predicted dehydrogenase
VAVGSRAQETADAFGDEFGVPHRHASYEALAPTRTWMWCTWARHTRSTRKTACLCLQAGKAVLCEKPFAINAVEAGEVIALVRKKGLFLIEAN